MRADIEARLDFSDEGDVEESSATWAYDALELHSELMRVLSNLWQGRVLRDGFRVVFAGPPNSGKSSLLNALSRSDAAIVSDEPGTTRDLKEVPLDVRGQLIILVDSAGQRETSSKAEAIGVERARAAMLTADVVLWLQAADQPVIEPPDSFEELGDEQWRKPPIVRVGTKLDLGAITGAQHSVSVVHGRGIPELLDLLYDASGAGVPHAELLVSRERDREALQGASTALSDAASAVDRPEIAAEHLRSASAALERLLGRMDVESVLDHLFSAFCIGK